MFSTAQIISKTNAKSFDRGRAIADAADQVTERRFASDKSGCEIFAKVKSASAITERFACSVFMDKDCEEIESYECNCPAARKYKVMCKHCVACALSFKRNPDSFIGYKQRDVRPSSRTLKRFLADASYADLPTGAIPPADAIHDVSLFPEVTNDFDSWSVRFRISGHDGAYVVNDISEMVHAIDNGEFLRYGKRLGFIHSMSAFDESSKRIAELVSLMPNARKSKKTLRLNEVDVVRLFDAIGDAPFDYNQTSTRTKLHAIRVLDEVPNVSFDISEEDGGYHLSSTTQARVLRGGGHAYMFDADAIYRLPPNMIRTAAFLQDVCQSSDGDVFIADEDLRAFCMSILPALEENAQVCAPLALDELKPSLPQFDFYFDKEGRGQSARISLKAKVSYGKREYDLIALEGQGTRADAFGSLSSSDNGTDASVAIVPLMFGETDDGAYRDEHAENDVLALVSKYFPAGLDLPLTADQKVGELLFEGLSRFQESGSVYTTQAFDRLLRDVPVKVNIGISLAGNLIDLDISSSDVPREELARILSSYRQKKLYHRLKDGTVASLESLQLDEFERLAQDLGLTLDEIRKGSAQIPAYNAFLLDREYSGSSRDKSFEEYIERFDDESLYDFKVPGHLSKIMRPYQIDGYIWMRKLGSIGFGGILADEMGLGKSIQAIAYISALSEEGELDEPALIICPASLVYNWVEEFSKFAPGIAVDTIDGMRSERRKKFKDSHSKVLIASYDTVRVDLEHFEQRHFSTIFLDETQYIKNHGTKTTRAIKRLKADCRFALTGTPIENRLSELWSIFDFLMPGFLGSYAQFRTRFESDIIGGDEHATSRLSALIEPFVLRRLKEDVLADLPKKQEIIYYVSLPEEQRKLYCAEEQSLREDLLAQRRYRKSMPKGSSSDRVTSQVDILAELLRLRQTSLDPSLIYSDYPYKSAKTSTVLDIINQAMSSNRKTLVFSQFTSYLDIIKGELARLDIPFYEITGATDKKERVKLVNAFNEDSVPVFLASLKAGGTGLNLTGASVVIHTDPWWNSAAINQATDRAHRIGQKSMVNVYQLIAKDTIEERMLRLQEAKTELADSIISDNSLASLRSLSRSELESLLLD